jgi:hypothetical protein
MEKEKIGVWGRVRMRGLKNTGLIEISQDPNKADYVLVMSRGIQRKWLMFNLPVEMWRVRCPKEEVSSVINDFLNEKILAS